MIIIKLFIVSFFLRKIEGFLYFLQNVVFAPRYLPTPCSTLYNYWYWAWLSRLYIPDKVSYLRIHLPSKIMSLTSACLVSFGLSIGLPSPMQVTFYQYYYLKVTHCLTAKRETKIDVIGIFECFSFFKKLNITETTFWQPPFSEIFNFFAS